MPPKRSASGTASSGQAKRGKTASSSSGKSAAAPSSLTNPVVPKPSTRWSAVSASRNADASFRLAVQDRDKANAYRCICQPPFLRADYDPYDEEEDDDDDDDDDDVDDDDEWEDVNEDGTEKKKKAKCDGGRSCVCNKLSSEHPEHEWVLTFGGFQKFLTQYTMTDVRDPDNFDMYTYNDHAAYGVLEVLHNLMLDYEEDSSNWQEQWWVCEAIVLFLHSRGEGPGFSMIDDGELAANSAKMTGRLFLGMLSRLEAMDVLSEGSEVKNLGLIMTLYIKLASDMRGMSLLEDDEEEKLKKPSFKWVPSRYDDYIHAYANKYGIRLHGVDDVEELTADLQDVSLPAKGDHLWDWPAKFKAYKKEGLLMNYGGRRPKFGGDNLDVTSWTSAARAEYNFGHKDPLGKKERDALKDGMVMSVQ